VRRLYRSNSRRSCRWVVCACWLILGVSAGAETPGEHLLALVESQDLDKISAYLAQPGVGIDDRPDDFKTLLDFAAERNQVKVAQYLIDHGADVNATPQGKHAFSNPAGTTPLCRAAYFNALETLDLLIRRGAEVNSLPGRASAIIYAAKMGNLKAVEMLLGHGANINQSFGVNQTAIGEAIQNGRVDVAHYLASHGATMGPGALHLAALSGSPDLVSLVFESKPDQTMLNGALAEAAGNSGIDDSTRQRLIELLLAHGADPDAPQNGLPSGVLPHAFSAATAAYLLDHGANSRAKLTGYELAAGFCNTGMAGAKDPLPLDQMLVARGMNFRDPGSGQFNPLTCAVIANRIDLIDFLLDHGANIGWPNYDGSVPIFFGSTREVIEDLLKHGADINQPGEQVQKDRSLKPVPQMTPLSAAIRSGQWGKVALLVSMGADVRTQGGSFLADVAVRAPAEIVVMLLDHGVDANARDTSGDTALMEAVRAGRRDRVQLLLDRGADVNVQSRMGRTALHLAVEAEDADMLKLLLARGADRRIGYGEGISPLSEARTEEVRRLLADGAVAPMTDGTSARERADCAAALASTDRGTPEDTARAPLAREQGEDWDYLDQVAGNELDVSVNGRHYLFAASGDAGYLGRVDSDGVERIVCEYGKGVRARGALRPLTDYERLQARSQREFKTISLESLQLQGVRGAVAILGASRRSHDPVRLEINSDGNLLGDAAESHRDDILAYYLEHGVDANLGWLDHSLVDGVHAPLGHVPPLYTALSRGSVRAVALLLAHGASPDAAEAPLQMGPQWVGKPALAVAVLQREAPIVEALLAHGADPNMPSGSGFPPGVGGYSGFHQVLGGQLDQWVSAQIYKSQLQQGPDLVANAAVMFRHGASPDPWRYTVLSNLQLRARANGVQLPGAVLKGIGVAPDSAQVREVADEIRVTYPAVSNLLSVGLRFRDAPLCDATTALGDLQYCLPKSLHAADDDLNTRYDALLKASATNITTIRNDQRAWIGKRDQECGVKELSGVTQAGWLAYVLSEPVQAQCVLKFTGTRSATLAATRLMEP
jgi:ankyrin repeat protein/uncharacterized protein YecT (DUF1311 family)